MDTASSPCHPRVWSDASDRRAVDGDDRQRCCQGPECNLFDERYNSSAITNAFGRRYYEPSPDREIYVGITFGGGVR